MNITQITFSRLVSGPGYSNITIGATANLTEDEAPENALAAIEGWVGRQFELRRTTQDEVYGLEQDTYRLRRELGEIDARIAQAKERWETVKAVSARLGIDLTERLGPELDLDDVPF